MSRDMDRWIEVRRREIAGSGGDWQYNVTFTECVRRFFRRLLGRHPGP